MIKELSMTPDAIRKREKRAAEKGAATMQEISKEIDLFVGPLLPQVDSIEKQPEPEKGSVIIKVGHALLHHRDGKVTKDSIWGIAQIGKFLVKFYGRRGATPRFRLEKQEDLNDALALFELKKEGKDAKKLLHLELDAAMQTELLGADFAEKLEKQYYEAVVQGKVDRRAVD